MFKRCKDLDISEEGYTESIFIQMTAKDGKRLVVGSMYKAPNTDPNIFSTHWNQIVENAWSAWGKIQPEIIIGMDHNMDLLKVLTHPYMYVHGQIKWVQPITYYYLSQ